MVAKQLSIFLENKSGRLTEVTEVLAKEGVNLSALCIAENADFGILRGIVSEPDKAYKALKDNHFAVNVTDVVGISCPNIPGSLAKVLRFLSDEGVFIEYMYSFANGETANVIIRPNDMDNCIRVLTEKKVEQAIGQAFGGKLVNLEEVFHGVQTEIRIRSEGLGTREEGLGISD